VTTDDLSEEIRMNAAVFRGTLSESLPLGDDILDGFPKRTCGDVSWLLGEYLYERHLGLWFYCWGLNDGSSHAWLEQDGLIVDVTANQFADVGDEVIVSRNSSWYEQFTRGGNSGRDAARIETLENQGDPTKATRLRGIYDRLFPAIPENEGWYAMELSKEILESLSRRAGVEVPSEVTHVEGLRGGRPIDVAIYDFRNADTPQWFLVARDDSGHTVTGSESTLEDAITHTRWEDLDI
jgi:hypothetical protein